MNRLKNAVVNSELKASIEKEAVEQFSRPAEVKDINRLPLQPKTQPQRERESRPEIQDFHSAVDLDYDEAENELLPLAYETEALKKQDVQAKITKMNAQLALEDESKRRKDMRSKQQM